MLCCGSFQLSVSPLHVIRWLIRQWLMHGAAGCAVAAALRWRLRRLGVMPRREAKSNEEFIPLHWKRSFGHLILYVGHATLAWLVLPVCSWWFGWLSSPWSPARGFAGAFFDFSSSSSMVASTSPGGRSACGVTTPLK